jgi:hypothetical protein
VRKNALDTLAIAREMNLTSQPWHKVCQRDERWNGFSATNDKEARLRLTEQPNAFGLRLGYDPTGARLVALSRSTQENCFEIFSTHGIQFAFG